MTTHIPTIGELEGRYGAIALVESCDGFRTIWNVHYPHHRDGDSNVTNVYLERLAKEYTVVDYHTREVIMHRKNNR
jgi:hypothetical protein